MSFNRYAAFLLCLSAAPLLSAQVTINDPDNVPVIGDVFPYHVAPYAAPPAAGQGQVFDYSGLSQAGTATWSWLSPSAYSNPTAFSTADLMATSGTDSLFFEVTANGLERVGERQLVLGQFDLEVPLSDASLDLKLPLTFGDNWNDAIAATYMAGTYPSSRSGTIYGVADADGYLLLPGAVDPVPVVRVFTFKQEVNVIEADLFDITVVRKRSEYAYYAPFLKTPLLRAYTDSLTSTIGINQNTNNIEWIDGPPVGIAPTNAAADLRVFPNPAQNDVSVLLSGAAQQATLLDVMDATGRIVRTQRIAAHGAPLLTLSVADLSPGCYTLCLRSATGLLATRTLVKN